jgi:hypothetical protein
MIYREIIGHIGAAKASPQTSVSYVLVLESIRSGIARIQMQRHSGGPRPNLALEQIRLEWARPSRVEVAPPGNSLK